MRLRLVLFLLLVLAAQVPVTGLGAWVRGHLQESAVAEVSDRHLLFARNLATGIERHLGDVKAAVTHAADRAATLDGFSSAAALYAELGLEALCSVRLADGWISIAAGSRAERCGAISRPQLRDQLSALAEADNRTVISPLIDSGDGVIAFYVVHRHHGTLVAAQISRAHFAELAQGVRFGQLGHAVIVDNAGRVIAHPRKEWVAAATDIHAVAPIAEALAGREGVTMFHSPAFEADMVAGYAPVRGTGWAVMVPQPVAELQLRTFEALKPIYALLGAAFLGALAVAHLLAGRIARPLERLTAAARRADSVSELHEIAEEPGRWAPAETREIVSAFNGMVRSIRKSETRMRRLAYEDSLTGLLNRASFGVLGTAALQAAAARGEVVTLFYFDIDDFKQINDQRGHAAGDAVLVALAAAARSLVKARHGAEALVNPLADPAAAREAQAGGDGPRPCLSRFGGDEFVLVIPGLADEAEVEAFAEALQAAARAPVTAQAGKIRPSISIGIARGGPDLPVADPLGALLHMADAALYHAKARGKGCHCLYAPERGIRSIHEVRDEVAAAIAAGEMVLHYQPKVDARSGAVRALEALVRWNHPRRGLVMPADFIAAIEDSDVIVQLGEAVLRRAAEDLRRLSAAGRDLTVAVNIASRHFGKRGFTERMQFIAEAGGVHPSSIILEITEEDAMRPEGDAGDIVAALKAAGFGVALDDYGRGYSNLQRLAQIPINSIKLDRSLIAQVNAHDRTREIVAATVAMADALSCSVVAEGVENAAQAATLRRLGCHELQGYHFARPMPLDDVIAWLDAREHDGVGALRDAVAAAL